MLKGKCLCGAVGIKVEGELEQQPEACHCTQCRKQTGHFLAAVDVRREALTVNGNENVSWYQSSDKARRGFCSVCGSTLFWSPTIEGYEYIALSMGLFEGPTGAQLEKHIFVGDKGDYYEIGDGLPQSVGWDAGTS